MSAFLNAGQQPPVWGLPCKVLDPMKLLSAAQTKGVMVHRPQGFVSLGDFLLSGAFILLLARPA